MAAGPAEEDGAGAGSTAPSLTACAAAACAAAASAGYRLPPLSLRGLVRVQRLVELCVHRGVSQAEAAFLLERAAGVEPLYTDVVWFALEDEHPRAFERAAEKRGSGEVACAALLEELTAANRRLLGEELPATMREATAPAAEARIITDASDGTVVWVNKAWERLCGYSMHEAVGKTPADLLRCEKTDEAAVRECVAAALSGAAADVTVVNRKKGGEDFINHLVISPLARFDPRGPATHMLGVLREVAPAC